LVISKNLLQKKIELKKKVLLALGLLLMVHLRKARGLRNNNPGNIRHGDNWQGRSKLQLDPSFITFKSAKYGVRAMTRVLNNYRDKYNLVTVSGIIDRWAPPVENDTTAYVLAVSKKLGVFPNTEIDTTRPDVMLVLVESIIHHENGSQPFSADYLLEGISLA
jgi:hypothetical protein